MNRLDQLTTITQMIESNQSINSIYCWHIFRKIVDIICLKPLAVWGIFWINWNDSIIPVAQIQSAQSHSLWKRIDSITNQLGGKRNWINSIKFAGKNELIQINQLNWVDWYTSLLDAISQPPSPNKRDTYLTEARENGLSVFRLRELGVIFFINDS